MIYAVVAVAVVAIVGISAWFRWRLKVLETDRDNALMLIGALRKELDIDLRDEIRNVQGFHSEQIQIIGKRVTDLEDAPAAPKKEEPVLRFRGASDFRKFMEQGI